MQGIRGLHNGWKETKVRRLSVEISACSTTKFSSAFTKHSLNMKNLWEVPTNPSGCRTDARDSQEAHLAAA